MKGIANDDLQTIIDSFQHPFYVIDVNNYRIVYANRACGFGDLKEGATCHLLTHKSQIPCGKEHVCPLKEVVRTGKSVKTEHVHYDSLGRPRNMEVHGDPVFDENGKLVMMIEYAFDITDLKSATDELREKFNQLSRFSKVTLGREKRVIELKQEVNGLLQEMNRPPKYSEE